MVLRRHHLSQNWLRSLVSGLTSRPLDGQQRKVISTANISGLVSKLSHGKQRAKISTTT
jgi:hypothetical protein